ncbi:hypothetical protein [Wolbachia endosymbiont of Protocalliphora sialia]
MNTTKQEIIESLLLYNQEKHAKTKNPNHSNNNDGNTDHSNNLVARQARLTGTHA